MYDVLSLPGQKTKNSQMLRIRPGPELLQINSSLLDLSGNPLACGPWSSPCFIPLPSSSGKWIGIAWGGLLPKRCHSHQISPSPIWRKDRLQKAEGWNALYPWALPVHPGWRSSPFLSSQELMRRWGNSEMPSCFCRGPDNKDPLLFHKQFLQDVPFFCFGKESCVSHSQSDRGRNWCHIYLLGTVATAFSHRGETWWNFITKAPGLLPCSRRLVYDSIWQNPGTYELWIHQKAT